MERLIDHARDRGIGQLYGDVLPQNQSMRRLCAALGFVEARSPLDDQLLRVSLPLRNRPEPPPVDPVQARRSASVSSGGVIFSSTMRPSSPHRLLAGPFRGLGIGHDGRLPGVILRHGCLACSTALRTC